MGKDSSEKTAAKKGTSGKKAPAAKRGSTAKKISASSKTTSKSSQTPKAKGVTKTGATKTAKVANPKARPEKAKVPAKKKEIDTKALLLKKFDQWVPDVLFRPEPAPKPPETDSSPPLRSADDEAEVNRRRQLLFKKFDLSASETSPFASNIGTGAPSAPPPPVSPPVMPKHSDPMGTTIKFALIGIALLVALVIKVSVTNRDQYYIVPTNSGVDIWQGIFAPMGRERLISLKTAESPENIRPFYTKLQVYPFIFNYYIAHADALLEKPGMPDFEQIKSYLNQAIPYAVTEKHHKLVIARLNNIDQMILLIKADVAASKETIADYEAALDYLKQAKTLDVDGSKSALIKEKMTEVESAKAALEKKKAQEEKATDHAAVPAK